MAFACCAILLICSPHLMPCNSQHTMCYIRHWHRKTDFLNFHSSAYFRKCSLSVRVSNTFARHMFKSMQAYWSSHTVLSESQLQWVSGNLIWNAPLPCTPSDTSTQIVRFCRPLFRLRLRLYLYCWLLVNERERDTFGRNLLLFFLFDLNWMQ